MGNSIELAQILNPANDVLTDAGRDLIRRLKGAGSPTIGQDAFHLSQMLASGDIPQKYVYALCEWLGYLPPGADYPLVRAPHNIARPDKEEMVRPPLSRGNHDPLSVRPSTSRLMQTERTAATGPTVRGRRKKERNRGGRPLRDVNFDKLPPRWIGTAAAARLLGLTARALQYRICKRQLPPLIEIASTGSHTLLRRVE